MAKNEYDLIVIGAGPGGYVAAIRAAQLGLRVAVVEKEQALGGTCLRVGCIPSKALLESTERYWSACHELGEHGVKADHVGFDLAVMMKRKEGIVRALARGVEGLLKKNKITRYTGRARFEKPGRIALAQDGKSEGLGAARFLIATGSRPVGLKGIEMDGDRIGGSTEALAFSEVPEHLVVIGAGYIGLELGSVWRRLGSRVTVLEYLNRILPGMDSEVAGAARKVFEKQGMEFRLQTRVETVQRDGDGCVVRAEGSDAIRCDRVLVAVGRRPCSDDLGLESVGIETDEQGCIPVNEQFETSAEGIYAIGDVIRGPMLAHKAEMEGEACAEVMAGHSCRVDYNTIPGVVYTHPEIATVGRTEDELRETGVEYRKGVFPFAANGRARALGATEGWVKLLADAKGDRVLGVHIIGPRAGDLIAEASVAMSFGASSEDIARCCHAHPTLAEALKEAAMAVEGRAVHM